MFFFCSMMRPINPLTYMIITRFFGNELQLASPSLLPPAFLITLQMLSSWRPDSRSPLVVKEWAELDCVLGRSWRGFPARANPLFSWNLVPPTSLHFHMETVGSRSLKPHYVRSDEFGTCFFPLSLPLMEDIALV